MPKNTFICNRAEAHKEKENDVRVLERHTLLGKTDLKAAQKRADGLTDDEANSTFVNLDELNASDNPVHVPRGLPKHDANVPQNIEDIEFELDESGRKYEQ